MSENIITAIGNVYSGLYVAWCLQSFECSCCMRVKYKGRSINKSTKWRYFITSRNRKNLKYTFCMEFSSECKLWVLRRWSITMKYGDVRSFLLVFCGQKELMQIRFTLQFIQCMATSVLRSQQCKYDVRKCWVGRNLRHIVRCSQLFVSGLDSSQHHSFQRTFRNLLTDKTNYKLGWYVEKRNTNV